MATTHTRKDGSVVEYGPSLAKGPAMLVGSVLLLFGLTGLLTNSKFPNFSDSFPDATVNGDTWLGFEVNGWTNFLLIAAGGLLLFSAASHYLAKTMSLIVGLVLAACAVIAVIDGEDVLGLAAANWPTKIGFAVAAGILLVTALMPRVTREREPGTETRERHGRFSRHERRARTHEREAAGPPS